MAKIESISSGNFHAPIDSGVPAKKQNNNLYEEKLTFTPKELNLSGKHPDKIVLSEKQVETKLFEKYGFKSDNPMQMELLKLRFDTKKSPSAEINWGKGQFVARRNSAGQYEITVGLRGRTVEALQGRLISTPNGGAASGVNPNNAVAANRGIDNSSQRAALQAKADALSTAGFTPEQKELIADLTQVGLSVVGIFDPTGIADGADAVISLGRGDYWGAGISALGIIPYLGDLAKIGKLPKLVKIVEKVVEMAKTDARFGKVVKPLLEGLKGALDKIPLNKLPSWLKESVEAMKTKIDDFFKVGKAVLPKISFNPVQLQKKFKHASDFGISGNFNAANAVKFQQAIESHIASPGAKVIQGTYRGNPVIHIYNPKTGINVMVEKTGEFISGWKLNAAQANNVLTRGSL